MEVSTTALSLHPLLAMLQSTGPVVKGVIFLLLLLSFTSWASMLVKMIQLYRISREDRSFIRTFYGERDWRRLFTLSKLFRKGLAPLLYRELAGTVSRSGLDLPPLSSQRSMVWDRVVEEVILLNRGRLNSWLGFLATVGNTAPFIGLFGTVWGIMRAFHEIGVKGSASLAVVAPGISEALITTALGIAVAVPAVVAYNHFLAKVERMEDGLRAHALEFMNMLEGANEE